MTDREVMEYDVVIVGAGPAGLACAIRLKQLKPDTNICVLEKASAVGAHALSGAVLEPGPLEQLLPNWRSEYTGMKVPAAEDDVRLMTKAGSFKLPGWAIKLSPMHNHGNFIVSLGQLTPWMAQQAEKLGIDPAHQMDDLNGGIPLDQFVDVNDPAFAEQGSLFMEIAKEDKIRMLCVVQQHRGFDRDSYLLRSQCLKCFGSELSEIVA